MSETLFYDTFEKDKMHFQIQSWRGDTSRLLSGKIITTKNILFQIYHYFTISNITLLCRYCDPGSYHHYFVYISTTKLCSQLENQWNFPFFRIPHKSWRATEINSIHSIIKLNQELTFTLHCFVAFSVCIDQHHLVSLMKAPS